MSKLAGVAILVRRFPKLSETFILGEIQALVDADLDIVIFSLQRPNETQQQPASEALLHRVRYIDDITAIQSLWIWGRQLLNRPRLTLQVLRECIGRREDLRQTGALLQACHDHSVRHLHVHYISETAALAQRVSAWCGCTFSISAHAKDIYLTDPEEVRDRIARASFVATCTGQNSQYLKALATTHTDKIHLVYHGIDSEQFRPRKPAEKTGSCCCSGHFSAQPLRIVSVGRFKEKKGFDVLVDACALLLAEGLELDCEIIGYGDQQSLLQQRIDSHGIASRVRLRAPITHDRMVQELWQADLFVLPCRQCADGDRDGIPNSLLEAMASALPVISSRVSGIPEVVNHGENGLLVEPDDAAALAHAIQRLRTDPELRHSMGQSARASVKHTFDWRASAHSLISLLEASRVAPPRIAYIMKGFPRLSETFIANEIRHLQSLGLDLALYSVKQGDELVDVSDLPAVHYAPTLGSLSNTWLIAWLAGNLGFFRQDLLYWLLRHPLRFVSTLVFAVRLALTSSSGFSKSPIRDFLLATHFASHLYRQCGFAHIHAHFCHDATTIAWMVSQLCRLPFSFTAHAKDIYQKRLNPGDLLQRKLDAATFAVTCTEANVTALRALARHPGKVHGIYHGLDTHLFLPAAECEEPVEDRPLILSVGRHVEKKGFVYLIEASLHLRDRGISHRLQIIGEEGDQTGLLQAMIREHALEAFVQLLPPLQQHQLVECYRKASVFVLPCVILDDGDRDGIPNVMAEAMACALPVVVTGISGIPEMVNDWETGLIVAQRDSEGLADAIAVVLDDPALANALGKAARKRVEERFDAKATHVTLRDLFHDHVDHRAAVIS